MSQEYEKAMKLSEAMPNAEDKETAAKEIISCWRDMIEGRKPISVDRNSPEVAFIQRQSSFHDDKFHTIGVNKREARRLITELCLFIESKD